MRYSQVFWDFDGTLVDTYRVMVPAFAQALMSLGVGDIEIDDAEIYQTMREHSLGTAYQQFGASFGLNQAQLKQAYRQFEQGKVLTALPFKGVADVLSQIVDHGGRNYLVTHRDESALAVLDQLALSQFFTDRVTSSQPFPRKPDPASLIWLVDHNQVQLERALMVGDRRLDVEAGHRAGMASALFDPDHLIIHDGQPEVRLTQMAELADWLNS